MRNKIGVVQLCSTSNAMENLGKITQFVQDAALMKCKMVFFPECSDYIDGTHLDLSTQLKELSFKYNMWMSIGIHHQTFNKTKMFNRQLVIDNKGKLVDYYDKIHLFSMLNESDKFEAGKTLKVVDSPVGYLGLGICYDLRFPLFSSTLREMGATLLTYPSAFTKKTGVHFEPLLIARAIENQCFVVGAAQCGNHGKRETFGNSLIVDPWGQVLARATKQEELITATIDNDYLLKIRSDMSVFEDKRADFN